MENTANGSVIDFANFANRVAYRLDRDSPWSVVREPEDARRPSRRAVGPVPGYRPPQTSGPTAHHKYVPRGGRESER